MVYDSVIKLSKLLRFVQFLWMPFKENNHKEALFTVSWQLKTKYFISKAFASDISFIKSIEDIEGKNP